MKTQDNQSKVAIVIPVYGRRDITLQGLRSLSRIDRTGLSVRIFVVDDASPDGTGEALRAAFPDVFVIEGSGDLHYAAGTNRGISAALEWQPDFLLLANDDAVFHRSFLQCLVATAKDNPRSVVGSLLLLWNEPYKVFQVAPRWNTRAGGWVIPDDITIRNVAHSPLGVEAIVGNCVLVPRTAIEECGVLDEKKFPHGWGDAQFTVRLRNAGWQLLVDPNSRVWCEPNTNPMPLHEASFSETLNVLVRDQRHPVNLRRQFVARWESAPSGTKAVAAFTFYLISMSKRAIRYRVRKNER